MITIKYKGEIVDIKDIEITWQVETYREWWGDYIIMDIDELGYIQHWDETLVHKFVNDILNKK